MEKIGEYPVFDRQRWGRRPSGIYAPGNTPVPTSKRPTCVDLFCGAGGFSLGMIEAGWNVVAGVDNWEVATETYLMNLGANPLNFVPITDKDGDKFEEYLKDCMGWNEKTGEIKRAIVSGSNRHNVIPESAGVKHFFFGNIRNLSGDRMLEEMDMERGELDCVVGGPPCQGFSVGGRRNVMDPRNSLVFEFARLVLELWPKTMVMENVPGIVSMVTPDGMSVIDAFCRVLEDGGWGTYDAIRKSLLTTSDSGAALRMGGNKKSKSESEPAVQPALI